MPFQINQVKVQSSESLVKALLDNVINFANHGAPKELLLDRGADLYIQLDIIM